MLHVTSGDAAADSIRRAQLGGIVLPWHDVLHEGPVRMGLGIEALRRERAAFLASLTRGDGARIERLLQQRDDILASFDLHEEVVLWFEADLFDQLQLLQVLERFAAGERADVMLKLVDPAVMAEAGSARSLGELDSPEIERLFRERTWVSEDQVELSCFAWQAFRAPDPTFIERLRGMDLSILPHVSAAFARHLEQFPSVRSGLGRTERAVLRALCAGERSEAELFRAQAEQEERPFLGATVFRWYLAGMAAGEKPAITLTDDGDGGWIARLTEHGDGYVAGTADFVQANGIDRWRGGVHQHGHVARWRWDEDGGHLRSLAVR